MAAEAAGAELCSGGLEDAAAPDTGMPSVEAQVKHQGEAPDVEDDEAALPAKSFSAP